MSCGMGCRAHLKSLAKFSLLTKPSVSKLAAQAGMLQMAPLPAAQGRAAPAVALALQLLLLEAAPLKPSRPMAVPLTHAYPQPLLPAMVSWGQTSPLGPSCSSPSQGKPQERCRGKARQ